MGSVKLSDTLYYGIHPTVIVPEYKIDHFIELTEFGEMDVFECPNKATCKTFPIKDRTAVKVEKLAEIVDYINSLKGVVYIYCKGGHGRSGMVAAAVYGKQEGLNGKEALEHVNTEWKTQRDMSKLRPRVRKLGSPQTKAQKDVVEKYLNKSEKPPIVINQHSNINTVLFYDPKEPSGLFSNFYPLKKGLTINGEHFIDTEQYFQVMKFRGKNATPRMLIYSNLIRNADSPAKVKMLGVQKKNLRFGKKWKLNKKMDERLVNDLIDEYKDVRMRSDWDMARIAVMINGLYHKFTQYTDLNKIITNLPDNTYLVEHTTRDRVWGDGGDGGDGQIGQNMLGKILTALSYVLKHGSCDGIIPELQEKIKIKR